MKVEELIIDGFKSYATRTVISGWDSSFNCITGLNGSGKSNILDAICFVLGITTMSLVRAQNLQDLIYKRGQAGVTKASVTIVFDNTDKATSPIGFEQYATISVTRQIVMGGTSKYLINGHRAQQQTVLHLFQSVQLNINNPNFLIMQGKITKVLNMKPQETLSLIEEAAGTKMFEDRREKAEKTMAKKETKLTEIRTLLQEEIEPRLDQLRTEKRIFLEYQQTQTDLEKLSRIVTAHDYKRLTDRLQNQTAYLRDQEEKLRVLDAETAKYEQEIITLSEDIAQTRQRKEKEIKQGNRLKNLEQDEITASNEITRLRASLELKRAASAAEESKRASAEASVIQLTAELKKRDAQFQQAEEAFNISKKNLAALTEQYTRKDELLSTLRTGISASGGTDGGFMGQLEEVKDKIAGVHVEMGKASLRISHLEKEMARDRAKVASSEQANARLAQEITDLGSKKVQLESQLAQLGWVEGRERELVQQQRNIEVQMRQLGSELENMKRRMAGLEFNYTRPHPNFDPKSVKGLAAQLFTLDQENFSAATALEVCAGGRLYNVVVDTENTGSALLQGGNLRKRVTIIPLNKIRAFKASAEKLGAAKSLAPGKVNLALDLIGYEQEVSAAMEYIFGSTLVCQDAETAKQVTFNPNVWLPSVTLDGDYYDPSGTLSGGSRATSNGVLVTLQEVNRLSARMRELKEEHKLLEYEISKERSMSAQSQELVTALSLTTHQIKLNEAELANNGSARVLQANAQRAEEIAQLQKAQEQHQLELETLNAEAVRIEKDMKEMTSNRDEKIKCMEQELSVLKTERANLELKVREQQIQFQELQIERAQMVDDVASSREAMEAGSASVAELEAECAAIQTELTTLEAQREQLSSAIQAEKAKAADLDSELQDLEATLARKNAKLTEVKTESRALRQQLGKYSEESAGLKKRLEILVEENEWVNDHSTVESVIAATSGINLNEYRAQMTGLAERFRGMQKKVNAKVMNMIDNVEKKEASLKAMIKTIEKDKRKIEETIVTLNEYKRQALHKTFEKVSVDFGNIFADLLTGSFAKLVLVDPEDITKGLDIKVRLGKVWKQSLVELSGGQRSLIALSLILSLLQFKPAPMYILDEVDAALDLSHTQNIGHLIKTRFKGSQFIVVSLKEGFFSNANRVFKARFQDGTSHVSCISAA